MIYPSADKLNKIGSKYKLIAMASTRSKQITAGMKPLIETTSTNPLTIAFEEIAAGVITANIDDMDELSIDYSELSRISARYDNLNDEKDSDEDIIPKLGEQNFSNIILEKVDKTEIAEAIKAEPTNLDDINEIEIIKDKDLQEEE